ncbi:MAG: 6-phosphogluconolactonase [Solirubrobacterales bacterium]
MRKPQIEVASDAQDLALRAVRLFVSLAGQAVADRGVFRTAFSGGHTPELFFRRLATESAGMPWDKTHVFWVDERYVPPDSSDSNYRLAAEMLLTHVEIPETNVHRIPTEFADAGEAALAYERTIRDVFGLTAGATHVSSVPRFDLILLGMGSDGHTASLFPNSSVVYDAEDLARVVHVGAEVKPQVDRITLTPPVLLAARRLVVLVSGREKAETLRDVFAGESSESRYPIRLLWPALDRVTWLVDQAAAEKLA